MVRRKASKRTRNAKSKWSLQTFDSMADADKADREYWWSRSPAERMRELELNWGYGKGKPTPRLVRVFRVENMGTKNAG